MTTYLIAILVLLLLSGFFSGSETALTAASRHLMHRLEQDGNPNAAIVNRLLDKKDRLIGAILLGNNLVNILSSVLATSILITLFGETGIVYATAIMTILILIFSEILPKTYAFRKADAVALRIAPVIGGLVFVLAPLTGALQVIVSACFRIFGVRLDTALASSSDELRGAIELHEGPTDTVREERAMLHSVLDLQEVEVGEIMTHRTDLVAVNADDPIEQIVEQTLASPYTRIPLWRDDMDNIVGVLHAKALFRAIHNRKDEDEKLDLNRLASAPWFVPETTSLRDQLQAFRERREHFSLVVDEYGTLLGVVSLEDILEEIVGDIIDEHDPAVIGLRAQADGSYLIDGTVTIRDLNRAFEWRLPDEEAATLAGLLLHESRQIPEVGQVFSYHECRFEVVTREGNQLTLIRVTPPARLNGMAET